MHIKKRAVPLTLMFIVALTLASCVRPYPQEEPAEAPPAEELATQPVIQPVTPLATPLDPAVTDPTPESVQPTVEIIVTEETRTETIHTVQAGDTLFKIASQYGVTIDAITSVNEIPNINQLEIGQQLTIPGPDYVPPTATTVSAEATPLPGESPTQPATSPDGTHVVQAGENLFRIALQYGCTTQEVAAFNGIANPNALSVGQVLNIPDCN